MSSINAQSHDAKNILPKWLLKPQWNFWLFFSLIVVLAIILRLYQIEARPLHSDEGVNYYFLERMLNLGFYPYSHENYHGPAYFWLMYAFSDMPDPTVLGLRTASIVLGVALMFVILPLRRTLGNSFVLISSFFIAISPSMVFHSRYAIHEMLFLVSSAGLAINLYLTFYSRSISSVYLSWFFLALLISTKETFVISLFCLFFALLTFGRHREYLSFVSKNKQRFLEGYLLFITTVYLLFSSGLRSTKSLRELFFGIQQWFGRGTTKDVGHFKPFSYYLMDVILPTEPYLIAAFVFILAAALFSLSILGTSSVTKLFTKDFRFFRFSFVWALLAFLVYSFVPYKTPWLVLNITFPALLLMCWCLSKILCASTLSLILGSALFLLSAFYAGKHTIHYNYQSLPSWLLANADTKPLPYGPGNPYSYVHSSKDMLTLLRDVREAWKDHPADKFLIAGSSYWPLPYYLRDKIKQIRYLKSEEIDGHTENNVAIMVDRKVNWKNADWYRKDYRLHDAQEVAVYFRN